MYKPARITALPDEPTLDEIRAFLAPHIAEEAVFDGWGEEALENAAGAHGVDTDVARLAYSGGAVDMVDAWISNIDVRMIEAYPQEKLADMKIRERIRVLVEFRLDAVTGTKEALRSATAIMANPRNAMRTAKTSWRSADLMWRLAGDTATDYNHYTKRTILSGVYSSTVMVFLGDESDDHIETKEFLSRRLDNVMQFEKVKYQFLKNSKNRPSLTRFLGRLRYPAR
ncbi:COQ9 family protein [Sphingorhabdus sp. Alg239-R122]|uniref:COQ9 family protein n=1 Tax=Sphingorhabdus sp. Alg239-R122 TaxID=2305989 RepID=UPI0013DC7F70|nr:COQ9 family protein [Sphingorhabdus sp. Alg239-R122]